jgi:glycosyltransferase involved in cell wall biosynthesis
MRRVLHRFVNRIVTVSEDLKSWLLNSVRVPTRKVLHICNGVDIERFRPSGGEPRARDVIVGSVTRFSEIKDPLNLVSAFIELRRTGVAAKLHMIGDGEMRAEALYKLRDAGLEADAWLPGSRDDIPEQLRSMDVFVLGSFREGISNTVLEAMASGLPVIASDTGGNKELIADGVNGVLVPPGDYKALAVAIRDYVQDRERRRRHGLASRDRVLSLFSLTTMVENYAQLYRSVLGLQGP